MLVEDSASLQTQKQLCVPTQELTHPKAQLYSSREGPQLLSLASWALQEVATEFCFVM